MAKFQKEELTQRLKILQEHITGNKHGSKREFGEMLDIVPGHISKYMTGSQKIITKSMELVKIGVNLRWLFFEEGIIFDDSNVGREQQSKYGFYMGEYRHFKKISQWIAKEWGSFKRWCLLNKIDEEKASMIFNDKITPDAEFYQQLEVTHCPFVGNQDKEEDDDDIYSVDFDSLQKNPEFRNIVKGIIVEMFNQKKG